MKIESIILIFIVGCSVAVAIAAGPKPRSILVVSSESYSVEQVLESINNAELGLDSVEDKSKITIKIGDSEYPRYPMYDYAFWYPYKKSEFYGVAIVKYKGDSDELSNKYYIDVYTEDNECKLCSNVKNALNNSNISYYSACEIKSKKNQYESIRCDT